LALLALVRCRSLEQSRYLSPGECGKLLGLDRLPEVKTLRRKISDLCGQDGQAAQWQSRLAGEWMLGAHSQSVGLFYADGLGHADALTARLYDRHRSRPEDSPTFRVAY
jgi:hypothetical protein